MSTAVASTRPARNARLYPIFFQRGSPGVSASSPPAHLAARARAASSTRTSQGTASMSLRSSRQTSGTLGFGAPDASSASRTRRTRVWSASRATTATSARGTAASSVVRACASQYCARCSQYCACSVPQIWTPCDGGSVGGRSGAVSNRVRSRPTSCQAPASRARSACCNTTPHRGGGAPDRTPRVRRRGGVERCFGIALSLLSHGGVSRRPRQRVGAQATDALAAAHHPRSADRRAQWEYTAHWSAGGTGGRPGPEGVAQVLLFSERDRPYASRWMRSTMSL